MKRRLGDQAVRDNPNDQSMRDVRAILHHELSRSAARMDVDLVCECILYLYPDLEEIDTHTKENWEAIKRCIEAHESERRPIGNLRNGRPKRALVIAIILIGVVMLATAIAQAMGVNVWQYFIHWMEDRAMVTITQESELEDWSAGDLVKMPIWNDELLDALERNEMYPRLPKWMPEGYEFDAVFEDVNEWMKLVSAIYRNAEGLMRIEIVVYLDDIARIGYYERDQNEQVTYVSHDNEHFLTENIERRMAFWFSEPYEITISGSPSIQEIKTMIDSIYEWEE